MELSHLGKLVSFQEYRMRSGGVRCNFSLHILLQKVVDRRMDV